MIKAASTTTGAAGLGGGSGSVGGLMPKTISSPLVGSVVTGMFELTSSALSYAWAC